MPLRAMPVSTRSRCCLRNLRSCMGSLVSRVSGPASSRRPTCRHVSRLPPPAPSRPALEPPPHACGPRPRSEPPRPGPAPWLADRRPAPLHHGRASTAPCPFRSTLRDRPCAPPRPRRNGEPPADSRPACTRRCPTRSGPATGAPAPPPSWAPSSSPPTRRPHPRTRRRAPARRSAGARASLGRFRRGRLLPARLASRPPLHLAGRGLARGATRGGLLGGLGRLRLTVGARRGLLLGLRRPQPAHAGAAQQGRDLL